MQADDGQDRVYYHPFVTAPPELGGVGDPPRTLTELAMSQLSARLRRKVAWWDRCYLPITRAKWIEEALSRVETIRIPRGHIELPLSRRQVQYVMDELTGYAKLRDAEHDCEISCYDRIWESNSLLGDAETTILNDEISDLRNSLRPQTIQAADDMTLNIVDPLLYGVIYGRTLLHGSENQVVHYQHHPPSTPFDNVKATSDRFAYLPTNFSVSPYGSVKALSYINNINPDRTLLYRYLELLLSQCVPLFEHALTDLHRDNPLPQRISHRWKHTEWEEPNPPDHSDDEDGWATYERRMRHWTMHRPIDIPDVPLTGYQDNLHHRKHIVHLRGRTVQIITRIHEINIRPGESSYPDSDWHVEGMKNERIVMSIFYYASVENIAGSTIDFRMAVSLPHSFNPGDADAAWRIWGMQHTDPCHQFIGSTPIRQGLCIAFPNIYQHKQSSFRLVDPSKEGRQRVVAFLLIDPELPPLISTSHVPFQQRSWYKDALERCIDCRVPTELVDMITKNVDGVMDDDQALVYRKQMAEERNKLRLYNDRYYFSITFDVWNGV